MSLVLFVNVFASGRGTIVDSGTTDTYLPETVAKKFIENFSKITGGIQFSQGNIPLKAVLSLQFQFVFYYLVAFCGILVRF